MNTPISNAVYISLALVFGLYEIGYGFYAWRLNGFKFYVIAGLLIGGPFLAIAAILFLRPWQDFQSWEILIGLVWIFGVIWKAWRKQIARKNHPMQWKNWEAIIRKW